MKVIGLTSTYPASALSEADLVVSSLDQIQIALDGAPKLTIRVS
jgi:hypothetical protein